MKKIIPIIKLAADFANVMRVLRYREGHLENDAEHSYQLAMACWSANHQYRLGLDDGKILKYALVHDLVELYAGDTDAFGDKERLAAKKKNEERAFQQLRKEYGKFGEILEAIEAYNKKADLESHVVNVIDKLVAWANIQNSKDDYHVRRKVSIDTWKKRLFDKIDYDALDPKIKAIIDEAVAEVETKYQESFFIAKK